METIILFILISLINLVQLTIIYIMTFSKKMDF